MKQTETTDNMSTIDTKPVLLPTRPQPVTWDYVNCAGTWGTIGLIVGSLLMALGFVLSGTCG